MVTLLMKKKKAAEISRRQKVDAGQKLSLEEIRRDGLKKHTAMLEKHKAHVIDQHTRTRFIENELRARRYFLLPKLERWEQDREAWKKDMEEWSMEVEADHLMGHHVGLDLFRWPPNRPTFMPPTHFRDHQDPASGKPCPESCPGRKGDIMILDMWKRARENPENFLRIPEKEKVPEKGSAGGRRGKRKTVYEDHKPSCGPYGPPPSTPDQKKLGAVTDMPGVHIQESMPALHGGQPRAWVSQMAVASTSMVGFKNESG